MKAAAALGHNLECQAKTSVAVIPGPAGDEDYGFDVVDHVRLLLFSQDHHTDVAA